jgi:hypothetical protein
MVEAKDMYPPAEPQDETAARDDLFAQACRDAFAHVESDLGWKIGNSLVTRSDRWGFIWRADLDVRAGPPSLVNRIICWGSGGRDIAGTATVFGRSIPPL